MIDLLTFKYPKVTDADMAFPTLDVHPKLLQEARDRGYYNGNKPGNKKFSELFFAGGKIVFKSDIPDYVLNSGWRYCKALMRSWSPKHEEKEAVCGMLIDEFLLF